VKKKPSQNCQASTKISCNSSIMSHVKYFVRNGLIILLNITLLTPAFSQAPNITYNPSANSLISGVPFSITPTNSGGAVPATTYGQVTTFVGSLTQTLGYTNATGTNAQFNLPKRMVMDASGNIYLTDKTNNAIRKISPAGVVTTFAGSLTGASGYTDATGTSALFNGPVGIAIDGSGNLFVGDYNNNVIRKITPAGVVSTFYSQSGMGPAGMCFDGSGNLIATAQALSKILKITPAGVATTIAGNYYGYTNNTGTAALFANPIDVQMDLSGNMIVADYQNNAIRKITPAGAVTTIAGSTVSGNTGSFLDGIGTAARFNNPTGVAITQGGIIYVADFVNQDIRRIMPDGTVTLIAGSPTHATGNTDAVGTAATFNNPVSIFVDNTGTAYVVDMWAGVRKLVLTGYTLKGGLPAGLTFSPTTGTISGTPTGTITAQTDTITAYSASGYSTTMVTFGPMPTITYSGAQAYTYTSGVAISPLIPTVTGNPVPFTGYTTTFAGNTVFGSVDGTGTAAGFAYPDGVAIDAKGNMYVTDSYTDLIRKISPSAVVTTLAGTGSGGFANGTGSGASFNHPVGIAVDTSGNIYVADQNNNAIRKVTPAGAVTTLAGGTQGSADGTGTAAQFYHPSGVAVDVAGNVYVADYLNNTIRKITAAGVVTTFAGSTQGSSDGTGTGAQFFNPNGVSVDASANLYVSDRGNSKIRKITPAGVVTTLAGNGTAGFADGAAASAMFNLPNGSAIDNSGNLYISDFTNIRIRQISPSSIVTTLVGSTTQVGFNVINGVGSVATLNGPSSVNIDQSGNLFVTDFRNSMIRRVIITPYTISPALPAGLNFNPQTGIISGTPTSTNNSNGTYTISAYNAVGTSSTTVNIQITGSIFNTSSNQNYMRVRTPRTAITSSALLDANTSNNYLVQTSYTYYDEFGRVMQTVDSQQSPTNSDLVQPTVYDAMGRQSANYLPYTISSTTPGGFRPNALTEQSNFYLPGNPPYPNNATSLNPYSQTIFESTPLARITEQGFPGTTWQIGGGHTQQLNYGTNSTNEVRLWTVNSTGASYAYYNAGQLLITTVKDENGNTVTQYKDFDGKLICKKVQSDVSTYLYTDYVYDDAGNLRYVIPPLPTVPIPVALPTTFAESDAVFKNFFYGYHYDGRNRLTEKKVPGKEWEYNVYNKLDQVILSQTPSQLLLGLWTFTKYDSRGRVIATGDYTTSSSRSTLQSNADSFSGSLWEKFTNVTSNYGYTDTSYPDNTVSSSKKVLTVNYFDTYDFLSNSSINPNAAVFTAPTADTIYKSPEGVATGTIANVIGASTPTYLISVNQYDTYGRLVETISQSFKGGSTSAGNYDIVQNQYSFNSLTTKSVRSHYLASALQLTIANSYNYDQAGRKILYKQQYNSDPVINLAKYDYNELGQLITKHLHSTSTFSSPPSSGFLQHVDYRYNIRGWLARINNPNSANLIDETFPGQSDLFAEQIDYDQPNTSFTGTTPQFNGNISTVSWQDLVPPGLGMTQELKGYVLNYDPLNRLRYSYYKAPSGNDKYNETVTYDELGNILSLNRNATATTYINKLTYDYGTGTQRSNQLLSVQDNGGTENYTSNFSYLPNGNETTNSKIGVSQITYNELNLPSLITLSTGKTLSFNYSASGEKLERIIKQGTTVAEDRSYVHGIEYTANGIEFVHTEEGRARPPGSGSSYILEYQIADHLGNMRAMFGDEDNNNTFSTASDIAQETDYYAFGRQIASLEANPLFQYKYNGKEYSTDLNEYDYGARYYNPVTARWNAVDNDAEKSRRWSPYNYVYNNPIRNIDPDGQDVTNWWNPGYIFGGWAMLPESMLADRPTSAWDQGIGSFYNFMVHISPFGGVVDFANSARSGNVGGAIAGLGSTFIYLAPHVPIEVRFAEAYGTEAGAESLIGAVNERGAFQVADEYNTAVVQDAFQHQQAQQAADLHNLDVMQNMTNQSINQTTTLAKYWPPNGGALGSWESGVAMPGQIMDRYGPLSGRYASPVGTPFSMRALPPTTDPADYVKWLVQKSFPIMKSTIAPTAWDIGLGTQYKLPMSVSDLEQGKYIKFIP